MNTALKNLRKCPNGHSYYKSSDCPTCPICEQEKSAQDGFLDFLGAPARRALVREGIASLQKLASYSEREILHLHGMGPGSLPTLRRALASQGLSFKALKE